MGAKVVFIVVPGSRDSKMAPENALVLMCDFAKKKFNLSGGATCEQDAAPYLSKPRRKAPRQSYGSIASRKSSLSL